MTWLKIVQLISAILLMIAILLQNRGAGVSGLFGGTSNVYRTKRGIEKTLFSLSIVLAIIFFTVSILLAVL